MAPPARLIHRAPLAPAPQPLYHTASEEASRDPVPLVGRRASVPLILLTTTGNPTKEVIFRIDTGASVTQMSLVRAETLGLSVAGRRGYVDVTTAAGKRREEVVAGAIQARLPGTGRTFLWDCLFFADRPADVPPLLGLWDVLRSLHIRFDNTPSAHEPLGAAVFEEYALPTGLPFPVGSLPVGTSGS